MTTHLEYFSAELCALGVEAIRAAHTQACRRETQLRDPGTGPYTVQPGSPSAILMGDFNMRPEDPTRLRILDPFPDGTPPFVDAWTARHGEAPHPHSFCIADKRYGEPHCADYALVTADLATRVIHMAYDVETRFSDHQPVVLALDTAYLSA
jgi:endonuclease/exonuclease/phosphatase family metal-dependent hydrolase